MLVLAHRVLYNICVYTNGLMYTCCTCSSVRCWTLNKALSAAWKTLAQKVRLKKTNLKWIYRNYLSSLQLPRELFTIVEM